MVGAADLKDRYRFDERSLDLNGDKLGDWDTSRSAVSAHTAWLRGGEGVVSRRLEGEQPVALKIRDCRAARELTPGWRAVNVRTGQAFNITAVSPSAEPGFIDVLCVTGGASG